MFSQPPFTATAEDATAEDANPGNVQDRYADWPVEGGSDDPQPWDLEALDIDGTELGPGEPNTIAPIVVEHSHPITAAGDAGATVAELARLLKAAGIETSITRGENAFARFDQSVEEGVDEFRRRYGVEEDPRAFGGNHDDGRRKAAAHVGPWTWEALRRVAERQA